MTIYSLGNFDNNYDDFVNPPLQNDGNGDNDLQLHQNIPENAMLDNVTVNDQVWTVVNGRVEDDVGAYRGQYCTLARRC